MTPDWITSLKWALKQVSVECNVRQEELARLENFKAKGRMTQVRIEAHRSILNQYRPMQKAFREMLSQLEEKGVLTDDR